MLFLYKLNTHLRSRALTLLRYSPTYTLTHKLPYNDAPLHSQFSSCGAPLCVVWWLHNDPPPTTGNPKHSDRGAHPLPKFRTPSTPHTCMMEDPRMLRTRKPTILYTPVVSQYNMPHMLTPASLHTRVTSDPHVWVCSVALALYTSHLQFRLKASSQGYSTTRLRSNTYALPQAGSPAHLCTYVTSQQHPTYSQARKYT